jgi:hypothetical protein
MLEWCRHCGRKSLRLLGTKKRDRAGYTCGHCGLGFIINEAAPEAIDMTISTRGERVSTDPDGTRSLPQIRP